jgi:tRNA-specific 2-thiouridylase
MKRVVVGLSGGVDSAVTAALLVDKGYQVICVFMKNWDDTDPLTGQCTATIDYEDAKKVADKLKVPIYNVNFEKEYWALVFKNFLDEYKKGRTPNPDILCNKEIKFKAFLNYAIKTFQPDYIATGHYASIEKKSKGYFLKKGVDQNKDQTYFLAQIDKKILSKVLFPLGDFEKSKTRELAKKYNLPNALKKDSTGICFVGKNTNFKQFLSNFIPNKKGYIVNKDYQKVGSHVGVMYYTLGQRKGLNIGGEGGAWYVVGKDVKKNYLIVDQDDSSKMLESSQLTAININLFSDFEKNKKYTGTAKFRYRQEDVRVEFEIVSDKELKVYYEKYFAVTPGQQVVVYQDDLVVCAGEIDKVYNQGKQLTWI